MSVVNGYISSSAESFGQPTTSSSGYYFSTDGDTLRLCSQRNIASSSSNGLAGEICVGSETVLGVTTHYIYVCVANNSWKRIALSNLLF